jgi:ATP-dependent RNA helicase DDX51/DBP6
MLPTHWQSAVVPSPLPDAQDKTELVKQGLDRALARAQTVDPQQSTPLPLNEEDESANIGLSAKTLRRLKELGITELFAGA